MKQRPTTTYIILPAHRIHQHKAWLKLILHTIMTRLLRDAATPKVPTLFLLDEAAQIAGIPVIEELMAMLRGFGIKIASIYQDYPQACLALGPRVDSYVANSGVLIGLGAPQDLRTAEMLSERGGIRARDEVTLSAAQQKDGNFQTNFGMNRQRHPAVLPQELMAMPPGYAVLYSHQHAGARTMYFPDPSDVPEFLDAMG